ncbi:MAG: SGNH/GDSL hydrolase family protein [Planctomycetaceae bacterium]
MTFQTDTDTVVQTGSVPLRILALGDCNTITADPNQGTVPDGLSAAMEKIGFRVTVCNLGGGMETCREGLARLQDSEFVPDLAVINFGLVDSWVTSIPGIYLPYYPDSPAKRLIRKPLKSLKRHLRSALLRGIVPRGHVVACSEYSERITAMVQEIRDRNSRAAIYLWATLPVAGQPDRAEHLRTYNGILNRIATEQQTGFISTPELLSSLSADEKLIDGVHLSKAAANLIGRKIAQEFVSEATNQQHCPAA